MDGHCHMFLRWHNTSGLFSAYSVCCSSSQIKHWSKKNKKNTQEETLSPGDLCLDLHSLDATQEEKKISTDSSSRKLIMLTKHKSLQICLLTLELPRTGIIGYWHAPCLHEYKGFCFAFLNQFFGSRIFSRCLSAWEGSAKSIWPTPKKSQDKYNQCHGGKEMPVWTIMLLFLN